MRPARTILLLLLLSACSDAPNTQYLPIGSHCATAADCGTPSYGCDHTWPGGYCEKDCTTDGDCPKDAVCVALQCRRKCGSPTQCRQSEGYDCLQPASATTPICAPAGTPPAPTDAGATD